MSPPTSGIHVAPLDPWAGPAAEGGARIASFRDSRSTPPSSRSSRDNTTVDCGSTPAAWTFP